MDDFESEAPEQGKKSKRFARKKREKLMID